MKQSKQLYSQNKIAEILGISRGTFSKWLKENSVSPKQQKGQRKLYDETVIEQYKKSRKLVVARIQRLTTVELFAKNNLKEKQQEIDYLKEQLEEKDAQIKVKDETISEFGLKFAKLADQAQQLNLVDKSQLIKSKQETASNEKTVEKTPKNSKKEKRFWQFWK
ncbi:helix-turn-helix domain-containing protein (plasmid) [Lactobacillus kefiranofaciens subsp. kefirgranum]|uniref:helix-turn-helix domain-containing protein n=1 Tax=Lactobacillus kefiranofaciens TaxID=267818 RepID=UPI00202E219E|nr:helix-turn-helix domain-containing protein [Lactobacillus kefiranofaciens]URW72414.1 helix-turn-helix domain-containing protein [Lactobacillus kefiranofaciens subsp. kefirgranum]